MNRQRKVIITITYNDLGIIVDTKAEELDLPSQPNLQPTCNNLATDAISRQAAIDALEKWESESTWDEWCYDHKDEAEKYSVISPSSVVSGLPSAEPERKVGKWEQESESLWKDRRSRWKCSACGKHVLIGVYDDPIEAGLMFCPSCGAKMEETE